MFSDELAALLPQVLTSWQVLVVTVVLVLYMFLINYVARTYHRPRFVSRSKPQKKEKKKKAAPVRVSEDEDSNEALGLEEE